MVAEKDPYIASAAQTMYCASADERIRNLCEGRERGELTLRSLQLELQMQKEERQREKDEMQREFRQKEEALLQKDEALLQKDEALLQKDALLSAALARIAELEAAREK